MEFAERGGMIAYGPEQSCVDERSADPRGQDLGGRKAWILPVERPTKFDLVVRLPGSQLASRDLEGEPPEYPRLPRSCTRSAWSCCVSWSPAPGASPISGTRRTRWLPSCSTRCGTAARRLGVQLEPLGARVGPQVEAALRSLQRNPPDGLIISAELDLLETKEEIAGSIRKARLPTIFPWREYHDAGAIVSYGASLKDLMRRMGRYIDLILKGANPGELPVEQISKYELVVDMRVARSERIDIPESFLVLADEVIR